jgi:DNA polymerase-3 subunit alpha
LKKINWEKELLGVYISNHPLNLIKVNGHTKILDIKKYKEPIKVRILGVITNIKRTITKKNEPLIYLIVEDQYDEIEVVVFPKTYFENNNEVFKENRIVSIIGDYNPLKDNERLIAEKIVLLK